VDPFKIDPSQFQKLNDLRAVYQKEGLLGTFDSVEKLRGLVPQHLAVHVSTLMASAGEPSQAARPGFVAALPDVRVSIGLVDIVPTAGPSAGQPTVAMIRIAWRTTRRSLSF
jgi:hypothetical protein